MNEDIKYPNCTNCYVVIDLWNLNIITNAWQKDGNNHYSFLCPACKSPQEIIISVEDTPPAAEGLGMELLKFIRQIIK
jgi:hypothetical protein